MDINEVCWVKVTRCWGFCLCLAVSVILACGHPVSANVTSVTTSPAKANVSITRPTFLALTWFVEESPGGVDTVTSTLGQFIAAGEVLANVNATISQGSAASGLVRRFTFTETVEVPSAVVAQALKLGASSLTYQRSFTDSGGAATGFIALAPTGLRGAEFGLTRIELKFDDDSRIRVVPQGSDLTAIAEINFSGSGRLRGRWVVRDPTDIAGVRFRTLAVVYRNLAGGRRLSIRSPDLPTSMQGPYRLEFRVDEPELNRSGPSLDYYVSASVAATPFLPSMTVSGPRDGAALAPDTQFGWEAVAGADIYVVEVFARETRPRSDTIRYFDEAGDRRVVASEKPIAGKILRSETTATTLAAITTAHLTPNRYYLWSVKAIAANGAILKRSRLSAFFYPP